MRLTLLGLVALSWCLTIGAAAPVKMTPVKITEDVYMLQHSEGSGNSTVVFTKDLLVSNLAEAYVREAQTPRSANAQ